MFKAGLVCIEVTFEQEPEADEPEPLRMEHFYFGLGLWLVGLLLSVIFLLAEIIIHRRRKSQNNVDMLRLEEPTVTQSNPDLDVSENI